MALLCTYAMAKTCAVCSKVLQVAYQLCDRCGKATQLTIVPKRLEAVFNEWEGVEGTFSTLAAHSLNRGQECSILTAIAHSNRVL